MDRSFVSNLPDNSEDSSIIRAILSLADSLSLSVTAEGVETAEQLKFLADLGCQKVQGFHFSQAIPADHFVQELGRDPMVHRWADRWLGT